MCYQGKTKQYICIVNTWAHLRKDRTYFHYTVFLLFILDQMNFPEFSWNLLVVNMQLLEHWDLCVEHFKLVWLILLIKISIREWFSHKSSLGSVKLLWCFEKSLTVLLLILLYFWSKSQFILSKIQWKQYYCEILLQFKIIAFYFNIF